MKADDFRSLALSLPEVLEKSHMGHPDFRVGGKIFATLGPGEKWGMVKLTPEQQQEFIHDEPETFEAIKGGWGTRGATKVILRQATKATVRQALVTAWRNRASEDLSRQLDERSRA